MSYTNYTPFGSGANNPASPPAFPPVGRGNQTPTDFAESISSDLSTFNNAGGIWLPIFEAQVQAAYDQYRVFEPLVTSGTIESGKAKIFPMAGTVGFKPVWGAGDELHGGLTDSSGTFMITLDERPMAAHFELDDIDLLVTQWDFRADFARQCGERLANTRDGQILTTIIRGSAMDVRTNDPRGSGGIQGSAYALSGGWIYSSANDTALKYLGRTSYFASSTAGATAAPIAVTKDQRMQGAQALLNGIGTLLVQMREKNLPTEGMYCAVSPQAFEDLLDLGVQSVSYVPPMAAAIAAGNTNTAQVGPQYAGNGPLFGVSPTGLTTMNQRLIWKGVTIIQSNRFSEFAQIKPGGVVNTIAQVAASTTNSITATPVDYSTQVGNLHYGQRNKYGMAVGQFRACNSGNLVTHNDGGGTAGEYDAVDVTYAGADVLAVMWHPSGVVGLRKLGLSSTSVKDERRNTWFTRFHMYGGTDVMKPECCAAFLGSPIATKANFRTCLGGTDVGL